MWSVESNNKVIGTDEGAKIFILTMLTIIMSVVLCYFLWLFICALYP
jgi:regulatory protein YycH of two-component signal transduction system YycFG